MNKENNIFTIELEHIVLREYLLEDLEDLYAITHQPHIIEFLPDWQATIEQRADWLPNYEMKENQEFFKSMPNVKDIQLRLGIILKETGKFIGWCCTVMKDELPEPKRELVYGISEEYRGKGYVTEAVQGLVKFLFNETDVLVINGLALPNNIGSNKVLINSGFESVGTITIDEQLFNHYKIYKQEK